MKNTDIDHVIVDYLSRNFATVDTAAESAMLTTEDFNNEFRAVEVAFLSDFEINSIMAEAMNYKYVSIPNSHERVWLLKRVPMG